jgi:hypothetical protein
MLQSLLMLKPDTKTPANAGFLFGIQNFPASVLPSMRTPIDISEESFAYSDHLTPLPNEQPPSSYTDAQGGEWRYWPLSAADRMWRDITCNQFGCNRPAAYVGMVDVTGDGTPYYDSASAWCYWCMPREAMSPEAERIARHAEWARRQTVHDCLALIRRIRDEAGETDTVDAILTRLISDIRHVAESREETLAYSILPPEYLDGRMHTSDMRYAVRPVGNSAAVPDDAAALQLKK